MAHAGNGSASVSTHHNVETELSWTLIIRGVVREPRPTNSGALRNLMHEKQRLREKADSDQPYY